MHMSYTLRPKLKLVATLSGALLGALPVALAMTLPLLFDGRARPTFATWFQLTYWAAAVVWFVGLHTVGMVVWAVLERRGLRSPSHALLAGLVTAFLSTVVLRLLLSMPVSLYQEGARVWIEGGVRTPYGWFILIKDSALLALVGGMVAIVVWRIAYRRASEGKAGHRLDA